MVNASYSLLSKPTFVAAADAAAVLRAVMTSPSMICNRSQAYTFHFFRIILQVISLKDSFIEKDEREVLQEVTYVHSTMAYLTVIRYVIGNLANPKVSICSGLVKV